MSVLNFPTTGLYDGYVYTGPNGVTYVYDGTKWVGRSSTLPPGTNAITNNGNTVQIDPDGNLVTPSYIFPNTTGTTYQVLVWPGSGTTLEWSDQSGAGGTGPTGPQGTPGTTGDTGPTGADGAVGPTAPSLPVGPTAPSAPVGPVLPVVPGVPCGPVGPAPPAPI